MKNNFYVQALIQSLLLLGLPLGLLFLTYVGHNDSAVRYTEAWYEQSNIVLVIFYSWFILTFFLLRRVINSKIKISNRNIFGLVLGLICFAILAFFVSVLIESDTHSFLYALSKIWDDLIFPFLIFTAVMVSGVSVYFSVKKSTKGKI